MKILKAVTKMKGIKGFWVICWSITSLKLLVYSVYLSNACFLFLFSDQSLINKMEYLYGKKKKPHNKTCRNSKVKGNKNLREGSMGL